VAVVLSGGGGIKTFEDIKQNDEICPQYIGWSQFHNRVIPFTEAYQTDIVFIQY
jgi:hypothetical protein